MPVEKWSDHVVVAHLADDPQFGEDLSALEQGGNGMRPHMVLDFGAVHFVNSSNIARLLKLRKSLVGTERRLVLCNINTHVWGTFLVTGLDQVFEISDNVTTGLATIQMK